MVLSSASGSPRASALRHNTGAPPMITNTGRVSGAERKVATVQHPLPVFQRHRHRRSTIFLEPLLDEQNESEKGFKKWLILVGPHVGLALLCIIYTLAGASFFYLIERAEEQKMRAAGRKEIIQTRTQLLQTLWQLSRLDDNERDRWTSTAEMQLDNLTSVLFKWFDRHYVMSERQTFGNETDVDDEPLMWSFWTSVFFSASMVCTIGYGNLVPVTSAGRLFCVLFGLFGIPLMLVTIADAGKFIGDAIMLLYERWKLIQQTVQRVLHKKARLSDSERRRLQLVYDHSSVPVSWILLIIVGYTALGGCLLQSYEDWTFGEAFYFAFITMSTVGFGDFVPSKQTYYPITLIYIVLGLAITTMCVDFVGSQYLRKIHYFGRKIRSARAALRTVGDLMRYTAFLRRRYHLTDIELSKVTLQSAFDQLVVADAYIPHDIHRIYFIDQRTDTSALSVGRSSNLPDIDAELPIQDADDLLNSDDESIVQAEQCAIEIM